MENKYFTPDIEEIWKDVPGYDAILFQGNL